MITGEAGGREDDLKEVRRDGGEKGIGVGSGESREKEPWPIKGAEGVK